MDNAIARALTRGATSIIDVVEVIKYFANAVTLLASLIVALLVSAPSAPVAAGSGNRCAKLVNIGLYGVAIVFSYP